MILLEKYNITNGKNELLTGWTTIKLFGGRSSGRTYELITAMSECLYELNKSRLNRKGR